MRLSNKSIFSTKSDIFNINYESRMHWFRAIVDVIGRCSHGGFANFSSIARLGMKSMIAGLLACYLFAAVVGVLV